MSEPYRTPRVDMEQIAVTPGSETCNLSRAALVVSGFACLLPVAIACLVDFGILNVDWDSSLLPIGTVLAGLASAMVGLGLSIGAYIKSRSWMSLLGIVLAVLAIPCTLFIGYLLAIFGLATIPIYFILNETISATKAFRQRSMTLDVQMKTFLRSVSAITGSLQKNELDLMDATYMNT